MKLFYKLRRFFEKNKEFGKKELFTKLKSLDKIKLKQESLYYSASSKNGA